TARLIEWCKVNQEAQLKIFSDSAKDAKEEGCTHQQMTTQKNIYLQELATTIFQNDEDPKVRDADWPLTSYFKLRKKYNKINVQLSQTSAGLSFEAISRNEKMKGILDQLLVAFPWWVNLHGWWRTNPTYNTSFSTADPGQDFAVEA
ncbi:uncharacterized protein EDB93DRAFT_1058161, partial [Suillus bovinus]|uniref:uncharacterized protein n=1 Tax=Suillus bovinus TaxID=48563 RepID=UPI001B88219C